MEQAIPKRHIRIVKSVQAIDGLTRTEVIYGEYPDNDQVLEAFRELEKQYVNDPVYEQLHGLHDRLSLSFRNRRTDEIISFTAED